ncbi:hypothetical protein BH160DRAFT_4499 [Burkholderia sp. H160]|nr:hypothetical protein BH160DRAFT_4499 [Burkholderia sp. H160]
MPSGKADLRQWDRIDILEDQIVSLDYAGKSHDEAVAARKKARQRAQEPAGGEMAVNGVEADATHSCGELSERGKQVWRTGAGLDGGGKARDR